MFSFQNKSLKFIALAAFMSIVFLGMGCKQEVKNYDASGAFEADEVIISSEANGVIKEFHVEEGQVMEANKVLGYIDSTQLYLRKKQLMAQIRATGSRIPNILEQTSFYNQQMDATKVRLMNLQKEQKRFQSLVAADAAPKKQLDDINNQIDEVQKQLDVIKQQQAAQVSALKTQTEGFKNDPLPLYVQIEQLNDQISKCKIINPMSGTVLLKYADANEMTAQGKPLYKIADLSNILLRAYISGSQLPNVKLGQKVTVMTDNGQGAYDNQEGVVTWISDKAEFTPKTIQTKDERANAVYAIKIKVKNDGKYKIGMYGEVKF